MMKREELVKMTNKELAEMATKEFGVVDVTTKTKKDDIIEKILNSEGYKKMSEQENNNVSQLVPSADKVEL
jgi:hypothetical protein